ncbi:NAD-dependent epimerase/dehydratase family protein [Streptomyces sp. NPDC056831]|uniref:NAD-dependent epimerase/dehydratase family protein n=1 Tax=Streptomyces sp. NPDC056831 TaxID=3345954 RepID=UPI00368F2BE8
MIPWDDVLVTGAAGFIGRHTVAAFHRAGHRVTAVGLRPAPCHLAGAARWRRGDSADEALLSEIATGRYTVVVHQAGISDTRAPAGPEQEHPHPRAARSRCSGAPHGHRQVTAAAFLLALFARMGLGNVSSPRPLARSSGWNSWSSLLWGTAASFLVGAVCAMVLLAAGRDRAQVAFGPFVTAGALAESVTTI